MKNTILAAAISTALIGAVGLPAQQAYADSEVEALRNRVQKLEEALEKQTDQAAQAKTAAKAAEWAGKIKINGDFRYRNEQIQRDARTDQMRDRIRARIGLTAKATDTLSIGARLATGADDPRSSNQTLGAAGTGEARRQIGVDLYYVTWKPNTEFTITGGKMAYPYWRPGQSLLNDGDINPEGVAVAYQKGMFFANSYGFWFSERGTATINTTTGQPTNTISLQQRGSAYVGAQAGIKLPMGSVSNLTVALQYSELGGGIGRQPYWISQGAAATAAQIGAAANGNSFDANGSLLYDFAVLQAGAEFSTKLGSLPFTLFADVAKNDDAGNNLDQAFTAGFLIGKASEARTWELGYAYEKLEKDSYFGQFIDSDFAGGNTDGDGGVIRFGFAPVKNWTLNATYFMNKINLAGTASATAPRDEDYKRLQLDFNVKF